MNALHLPSLASLVRRRDLGRVEIVSVDGFATPADGGATRYARVADGEAPLLGDVVDAEGGRWRLDGPQVHVAMFGARGDGRTDDTAAIRRAIAVAIESGRPAVEFSPGATYRVFSGEDAEPLMAAQGVDGLELRFHGCRLFVDRAFEDLEKRILFKLTSVRRLRTGPLAILSQTQPPMQVNRRGVYGFAVFGESEDLHFGPLTQTGGVAGVFIFRDADREPPHSRTRKIRAELIHTTAVGYPLTCGHSGDDVEAEVVADRAFHAFFAYGVENLRIRLTTRNHIGTAVILMAHNLPRRGVTDAPYIRNVALEVTSLPATLDRQALFGGAQPIFTFAAQAAGPVTMEHIAADIRVLADEALKDGALVACLKLRPDDGGPADLQDLEPRGHRIHDVRVDVMLLDDSPRPADLALFSTPEWAQETIEDVRLGPVRFSPLSLSEPGPNSATPRRAPPLRLGRFPTPGDFPRRPLSGLRAEDRLRLIAQGVGGEKAHMFREGRWIGALAADVEVKGRDDEEEGVDLVWGVLQERPGPPQPEEGLAFQIMAPDLIGYAEGVTGRRSPVMLMENRRPLPGPHAPHSDIRLEPGLYSHWNAAIWFSPTQAVAGGGAPARYATLLLLPWPENIDTLPGP